MSRSSRNRKPKASLSDRCSDLRSEFRRIADQHRESIRPLQQTFVGAATDLVDYLDAHLLELLETENHLQAKSVTFADQSAEIEQQRLEMQRTIAQSEEAQRQLAQKQQAFTELMESSHLQLSALLHASTEARPIIRRVAENEVIRFIKSKSIISDHARYNDWPIADSDRTDTAVADEGDDIDQLCSLGDQSQALDDAIARETELTRQLRECEQERDQLRQALDELSDADDRITELELQNRDLAQKLATRQIHPTSGSSGFGFESMTWEQRKAAIMQQLAAEDADEATEESEARRVEIDDLLQRTDRELARRDAEIEELRRLLEEQSRATGDVAIGGAAILQMLDQDELIVEERARLQRIQEEWEEKLRQAEIDVSLERAKLARERMELEHRLAELQEQAAMDEETSEHNRETKGRKWLSRLGLSDEA
ncbi:MAG: hypothetical protein R3C05_14480 [Pirellulaceae bacterium]